MPREQEMIEINLNAPKTPEERKMNIVGNISLGKGEHDVPFMDHEEHPEEVTLGVQKTTWTFVKREPARKYIRFYSVGARTKSLRCPCCKEKVDGERVTLGNFFTELSCIMSCLSCCFPVFWICCPIHYLQGRLAVRRVFCPNCAAHLGFYQRPT